MTKRQRRLAIVAVALGGAAAAAALALTALGDAVAYFYTPADLAALSSPPDRAIRLGGLVAEDSVRFDPDTEEVRFTIADEEAQTPVIYNGPLPDLFREGQGVIALGRLRDGTLEASEILAKHDETYMPREVAEALKKQGRWRDRGS
jgi:cytochrome c-type biogenesis protein CcmE